MSCPQGCKEQKYNLLLKFNSNQQKDEQFKDRISKSLTEVFNWSSTQSESIVEFCSLNGQCLLEKDLRDKIVNRSSILAEFNVPHEVKLSKK